MRDEHIHLIQKTPYLFMAAAVSDYIPHAPQQGKLKKEMLGDSFALQLKKTPTFWLLSIKRGSKR